ncbi:unnamed protein product [Closterium sp. NIES-53]
MLGVRLRPDVVAQPSIQSHPILPACPHLFVPDPPIFHGEGNGDVGGASQTRRGRHPPRRPFHCLSCCHKPEPPLGLSPPTLRSPSIPTPSNPSKPITTAATSTHKQPAAAMPTLPPVNHRPVLFFPVPLLPLLIKFQPALLCTAAAVLPQTHTP